MFRARRYRRLNLAVVWVAEVARELGKQSKEAAQDQKPDRLSRITKVSDGIRGIVLNVTSALIAALLVYLALQQVRSAIGSDLVEITAFEVADEVTKQGTSGAAVAAEVAARLRAMSRPVAEDPRDRDKYARSGAYSLAYGAGNIDIEVPGTGFAFKDLTRAIQAGLAKRRYEVSGNVVKTESGLKLQMRVVRLGEAAQGAQATKAGATIEELVRQGVRFVAYQVNPYSLIRHDLSAERKRCATAPPCDFSTGVEVIKRLVREATPSTVASAYVAWCYALGYENDHKGATEKCRFATQADSMNDLAYQNWGIALNHLGKFEEAAEKFRVALQLNHKNAEALFGWGDALWRSERHAESLEKFSEGAQVSLSADWPLVSWGSRLLNQKRVVEGREKLQTAVARDPLDSEAWKLLAIAHSKCGDTAAELEAWRNVVELGPSDPEAHENVGLALNKLARHTEAVPAFEHAIQLSQPPGRLLASLGLGEAFFALKQYEKAIEIYLKSRALEDTADSHAMVGDALSYLDRDEEALAEYEAASKLAPDRESIFANWANSLLRLGRFDEAIGRSTHAIEVTAKEGRESKIGYINRAHAKLALGRLDEAIAAYRKASEIDSNFADAYRG